MGRESRDGLSDGLLERGPSARKIVQLEGAIISCVSWCQRTGKEVNMLKWKLRMGSFYLVISLILYSLGRYKFVIHQVM